MSSPASEDPEDFIEGLPLGAVIMDDSDLDSSSVEQRDFMACRFQPLSRRSLFWKTPNVLVIILEFWVALNQRRTNLRTAIKLLLSGNVSRFFFFLSFSCSVPLLVG